jgi:hypothetical protein
MMKRINLLLISAFCMTRVMAGDPGDFSGIRLKNKIVPLTNQVYRLLEHYEACGYLSFLPQAKPYTKQSVLNMLALLKNDDRIKGKDQEEIDRYLNDLKRESNGVQFTKTTIRNNFAVLGFGADTYVRQGAGDNGSTSYSLTALPYLSGDLGNNLSFCASMGPSIEQLTPDLFYRSYTSGGKVLFPYMENGFSWLPYQFGYETLYTHVGVADIAAGKRDISSEMSVGMVYYAEMNASWFDGDLQISLNNQRRAWGIDNENLVLSSSARRFPGLELKLQPVNWLRYSMLTGSLFHFANSGNGYLSDIYGYDVGAPLKMFSLHLLELTISDRLQLSATAGNIWVKRMEPAYLMPLVFPLFQELEVGDYDNLTMGIDLSWRIPGFGKTWFSVFNDEFSFTDKGNLLKMPRNRYAWQAGLRSTVLSFIIPSTTATLKWTRLTPFVYTHYPETRFPTVSSRPVDLTYTHDGYNLGFYLPPNSGELSLSFVNRLVPDLVLTLGNKLIIHGTNDLASPNLYQIYGDVFRYQLTGAGGEVTDYPLTDFTSDGIYDWTLESELGFDWKVRKLSVLNYFRIVGSAGIAHSWWKVNQSNILQPMPKTILTGNIGVVVDI